VTNWWCFSRRDVDRSTNKIGRNAESRRRSCAVRRSQRQNEAGSQRAIREGRRHRARGTQGGRRRRQWRIGDRRRHRRRRQEEEEDLCSCLKKATIYENY
jgi:hypothetical protein